MKFYEVPLNTTFVLSDSDTSEQFVKIKEQRISCCKVKCNAKKVSDDTEVVFKPMQDVEPVVNNAN